MKVVVVDPWHFTPPYDRLLCKGLAAAGHQITFVKSTNHADINSQAGEKAPGITTLGLFSAPDPWLPRSLKLAAKGIQHIRGMLRLLATLRTLKPDIIHFQWLSLPLVDALFLPLFRRIAPLVLTVHDSNPYNGAGPWLLRAGSALAMHRCDHFIVHNKISEERLIRQGLSSDRIHQIAHGLLENAALDHTRQPVRTDHRVHFLQFGKLKDYKGADIFLEALSSLSAEERKRCRVSIVGRPYIDTAPLTDLVIKHDLDGVVNFCFDFINDAEMIALFDETDFLVFPYREIDTSGVLMVAVARGIPVIASDIGCFAEMLTDGDEGVLVPPENPEELTKAIRRLIYSPESQASMTAKMKTLRERIPSWNAIAMTTTSVYERAHGEPASQPLGAHT